MSGTATVSAADSILPQPPRSLRRYVAPALAAVTVLGGVLTLVLVFSLPLDDDSADLPGRLAATAFVIGMSGLACVGALLAVGRDHRVMAWLMIVAGLTGVLARANVGYALAAAEWSLPGALVMAWFTNWSWVPAQAAAMGLLLRFPDGSLPQPGWRYVERLIWAWASVGVVITAIYPGPLGGEALAPQTNPLGARGMTGVLEPALSIAFWILPVLLLACVAAPLSRWRRAVGEERQQLKWVAAATALLGITTPFAVITSTGAVLEGLAYLALPAAIAVAVLRYHLWDLGLVVRRSAIHVVATVVLATVYLGLVAMLDQLVGERGWMAAAAGALVVASVAVPIHNAAQRGLDRLLFGNRRDPYAVVRDVGARLETAGSDVLSAVVEELASSLRLPYVAVELATGQPIASTGRPTVEGLRLPLVRAGDVLGHLVVGRRSPMEPLNQLDVRLFEDIAGHAGVAVQAVLLDEELRHSNQRLRTARDSERSRLQRELHDGLGPVLGAVTMRAEAARNLVRAAADPIEIDGVLAGIGVETEVAVSEVRRLLEELRPTVLVDKGLGAALAEFVEQYIDGIDVHLELPQSLPDMSAVSELTAYRVVTESLRNAARHSLGACCTVRVYDGGVELVIEVRDDGRGVGQAPPGIGLNAMRERVEESGGRLTLSPAANGGLTVVARVPRGAG